MATGPLVTFPEAKGKEQKPEDLQGRECKTNSDTCKENAEHKNIIHGGCSILPFELRI